MKWIVYTLAAIAGLIVLAIVVLLAIGGGRGEGRYLTTVEISQPANVVFRWVTEPQRIKSWVGWLVEIRSLTPGKEGVGARAVWVMEDRNNNNQRMEIAAVYTRYEPERLIEASLDVPQGFTGTVVYELEPLDASRTRLTYRANYQYHHWLAKLLEPVISRSARQKMDEDLLRLKQKAESE
jgi:uncharacterized protein YndB with AHSA1/START domain